MTEKRFIIAESKGTQWIEEMTLNAEPITNIAQAVKKLNDLSKENEKLKKQVLQLAKVNHENVEKVQSLANKNKQLKQDKQVLMDLYEKYLSNHINISLEFLND